MKILYIEDNAADADLVCRTLARSAPDLVLDVVPGFSQALTRLAPSNPVVGYDLVLTDLRLPDGSGTDVLNHIRARQLPVPVVLISAIEDEAAIAALLKAGADDYVVKSEDYLERLPATLQSALDSYTARARLRARPLKVLYADHCESDIEAAGQHLLYHAPHIHIERAVSAKALYHQLTAQSPGYYQVILLDYHLPDANGLEVLKTLREKFSIDIPVVVLAESSRCELALQALKLGAADYLVKHPEYLFRLPVTLENAYNRRQLVVERAALQRSQKALIESETRCRRLYQEFHALLDAIPDSITLHSPDLSMIWANLGAGRRMGVPVESIQNQSCCDLIMNNGNSGKGCPVAQTFRSGESTHIPDRVIDRRHWDIRTVPIKDDRGTVQKVICVARDVTQTRISERQLLQSQKMEAIGTLAGGIAHDFNNILAAIIGFDELALQHPLLASEIRPNLHEIFKASLRAKDLVQQIMDFSRQGRQHILPLKMETVVMEALKLIQPAIPSAISVETRFESRKIVEADATQLRQVLFHLCTNAVHAMSPAGGTLRISLEDVQLDASSDPARYDLRPGEYVCLKVQDNGPGMTPQVMERIFEPYFSTKQVGQGSGLGLAVVHGIVKGHRGAITVESPPGRGSLFTLFFPVAATQQPSPVEQPPGIGDFIGGSESILFVDDEHGLAGLGEQMLRRLGYGVKACTNPEKALALVQNDPGAYDLLISDLTMPQMSGLALAEKCKAVRSDLPVIICTGHGDLVPNEQIRAERLGIRTFIKKPARLKDMANAIRGELDGK